MNESPTCLSPLLRHSAPPGCPVVSIMGCPRASIKAGSELLHCLPDLGVRYSEPPPPPLLPLTTRGFTAFHRFLPEAFKDKIRQRKSHVHPPMPGLSREGQGNALLPHHPAAGQNSSLYVHLYMLLTVLEPISFSPQPLPQTCTCVRQN